MDVSQLSDAELRFRLKEFDAAAGPVTGTTRKIYEKKLIKYMSESDAGSGKTASPSKVGNMSSRTKQRGSARTIRETPDTDIQESSFSSLNTSSRENEKRELGQLNNRLATYIDRVRQLEKENQVLQVRIRDVEVVEKKEKGNLNARFEAEKDRLRRLLEQNAALIAKLEMERDTAVGQLGDLRAQIARLERDLKKADEARLSAETRLHDMQARVHIAESTTKQLETEKKDLSYENSRLRTALASCQKNLEDETMARAELQNKYTSALEEREFERNLHMQEMEEVSRKRQVEMTTVSKQLAEQYHSQLNDQIEEMRKQFADELAANRAKFGDQMKNRMDDARNGEKAAHAECSRLRGRIVELEGFGKRVASLETEIATLRSMLEDRDSRLVSNEREMNRLMAEYADLSDIKVQLDAELKTYHALLEGEESRLNLSQASPNVSVSHHVSFSQSGSSSASRGQKRRRLDDGQGLLQSALRSSSSSRGGASSGALDYERSNFRLERNGPVGIEDADEQSIRISNNGSDDVHLAGWVLKATADDREVTYKFSAKSILKAGATTTVWSSDSGKKHQAMETLVMKNQQWPVGSDPVVELIDANGEKVSWLEATETYTSADGQDRCCIM